MILDKKFYERETVTRNYQELLQKQRHIEEKMTLQVMHQQK